MTAPKILVLDIETAPITAYVWRLWDQNVGLNQIVDNGGIICVGAKWVGRPEKFLYSTWEHGEFAMLEAIHELMEEADAIVTYNGDKFDLPKLMGAFLMNGFHPPSPPTSIDVLKAVKRLGFISNRLAFIGPLLKLGKKIDTGGFELWTQVMDGDEKAQVKMAKYCLQDVVLLEKVYKLIRPYIKDHPHLGDTAPDECGTCQSKKLQNRGVRRTKHFSIQRIQCQNCGSWFSGKRTKVKSDVDNG